MCFNMGANEINISVIYVWVINPTHGKQTTTEATVALNTDLNGGIINSFSHGQR